MLMCSYSQSAGRHRVGLAEAWRWRAQGKHADLAVDPRPRETMAPTCGVVGYTVGGSVATRHRAALSPGSSGMSGDQPVGRAPDAHQRAPPLGRYFLSGWSIISDMRFCISAMRSIILDMSGMLMGPMCPPPIAAMPPIMLPICFIMSPIRCICSADI